MRHLDKMTIFIHKLLTKFELSNANFVQPSPKQNVQKTKRNISSALKLEGLE